MSPRSAQQHLAVLSTFSLLLTQLHASGLFDLQSYQVPLAHAAACGAQTTTTLFTDETMSDASWDATQFDAQNPATIDGFQASGGNPGSWRQISHAAGTAQTGTYNKYNATSFNLASGTIVSVSGSFDSLYLNPGGTLDLKLSLSAYQGALRFDKQATISHNAWTNVNFTITAAELTQAGFDLSTSGDPIFFGYATEGIDPQAGNIIGTDNVSVSVTSASHCQCSDGSDNDNDGATDFPADFSCQSETDDDEATPVAECGDGSDNDNDGQTDFPADPGCDDAQDNDETDTPPAECNDGSDNDNDGQTDFPADLGCDDAVDDDELGSTIDLRISKFANLTQIHPGGTFTWQTSIANTLQTANGTAVSVIMQDTLPVGAVPVSVSSPGNQNYNCSINSQTVTCTNPSVPFGNSDDIFIDVAVDSQASGTLTNCANVTSDNDDVNQNNNTSCHAVSVVPTQCSDGSDNDNDGQTDFPADPGCDDLADDDETDPPAPQCDDGSDNDNDGATDFPADFSCQSATDDDEATPLAQCQDGSDNDNNGATDFPADPGCSSAQDNDESGAPVSDLSAHKTGPSNTTRDGGLTYNITVTNNGPNDAQSVELLDVIPTGLTFDDVISSNECTLNQAGDTVVCDNFSLANGESRVFVVAFTIDGNNACDTDFLNQATVSSPNIDPNTNNNISNTISTTLRCAACSDGNDNDNDGSVDYPGDFSCDSINDNDEEFPKAKCQDGQDNDGDGQTDYPQDTGCDSPQDDDEREQVGLCTEDDFDRVSLQDPYALLKVKNDVFFHETVHIASANDWVSVRRNQPWGGAEIRDLDLTQSPVATAGPTTPKAALVGGDNRVYFNDNLLSAGTLWQDIGGNAPWGNRQLRDIALAPNGGPGAADMMIVVSADDRVYAKTSIGQTLWTDITAAQPWGNAIIQDVDVHFNGGLLVGVNVNGQQYIAGINGQATAWALQLFQVPGAERIDIEYRPWISSKDSRIFYSRAPWANAPQYQWYEISDNKPWGTNLVKDISVFFWSVTEPWNTPAIAMTVAAARPFLHLNPHDPGRSDWLDVSDNAPWNLPGGICVENDCSDGADNEGDGLTDFPQDPGCDSALDDDERNPNGPQCDNGIDDDNDGLTDFPTDPHCSNPSDDDEQAPACNDGGDNDGDGLIDLNDPGCDNSLDDDEKNVNGPQCDNGLDDDNDNLIDFPADPDCSAPGDNDESSAECRDGQDNDGDGATDFPADFGCDSVDDDDEAWPKAQCQDGQDNDNDGKTDFPADPGCSSLQDNDEFNVQTQCTDGVDNDNDGATDFPADFSCSSINDDDENLPKAQCQDGLDNDNDGLTDFPQDPGCSSTQDNTEKNPNGPACDNGRDDDNDGQIDFPNDPDCTDPTDNDENPPICTATDINRVALQQDYALLKVKHVPYFNPKVHVPGTAWEDASSNRPWGTTVITDLDLTQAPFSLQGLPTTPKAVVLAGGQLYLHENLFNVVGNLWHNITFNAPWGNVQPTNVGVSQTRNNTAAAVASVVSAGDKVFLYTTDPNYPGGTSSWVHISGNKPWGNVVIEDVDLTFRYEGANNTPMIMVHVNAGGVYYFVHTHFHNPTYQYGLAPNAFTGGERIDGVFNTVISNTGADAFFSMAPWAGNPGQFPWLNINDNQPWSNATVDDVGTYHFSVFEPWNTDALAMIVANAIPYLHWSPADVNRNPDAKSTYDWIDVRYNEPWNQANGPCRGSLPQCRDNQDNDGDGLIDLNDPGCDHLNDNDERNANGPECDNGTDDDNDGLTDFPADPGCTGPQDDSERDATTQCQDGLDNDNDGLTDFPTDPGCSSPLDDNESDGTSQCQDGLDNDNDGATDFPADFSCTSPQDDDETNTVAQCQDGTDNDNDGFTDFPQDPGCSSPQDNDETDAFCTTSNQCSTGNICTTELGECLQPPHCQPGQPCPQVCFGQCVPAAECADGQDNDGDGLIDFPADAGCDDKTDDDESGEGVDVAIVKDGPATVQPGQTVRFALIIANHGPGLATDIIAADPIPAGVSFNAVESDPDCVRQGNTILCDDLDLPPNSARTYIVAFDVPGHAQCNGKIINTASVSTSATDEDPNNNQASVQTTIFCPPDPLCRDGVDNDHDGLTDFPSDPGCDHPDDNSETNAQGPECDNGIDDDGDGRTDFPADADCDSPFDDTEAKPQCSDGIDNDFDGTADFPADFSCDSPDDNDERFPETQCQDNLDNDGDGLTDFPADPGCQSQQDDNEADATSQCQDGIDNDGDGLTDTRDPGCSSPQDDDESDGTSECQDGRDNDRDGFTDFPEDFSCSSPQDDNERDPQAECQDRVDNDGDGATDFPNDPGCESKQDNNEFDVKPACNDGIDNDGDGFVDQLDIGCRDGTDDSEKGITACDNDFDDDRDGLVDFPADPGCSSPGDQDEVQHTSSSSSSSSSAGTTVCSDGLDNDGDGLVDLADPGCSDASDNSEKGTFACDNGLDDDLDGHVDFPTDPGCASVQDQDEVDDVQFSSSSSSSSSAGAPNVTLDLRDSKDPVTPGETFAYTVTVTNLESHNIVKDRVSLSLDPDVVFVTGDFGAHVVNDVVRWENLGINAGGSVTLTAHVRVRDDVVEGDVLRSVAFGSPQDEELTRVVANDDDDDDTDVELSVRDNRDPVEPGEDLEYEIRVCNESDDDVEIDVRAFLDDDVTFRNASDDGEEDDDDEVLWEDVEIDADDCETLEVEVRVRTRADDGDRLKLRVRAGDAEETEFTEVIDDGGHIFGGFGGFGGLIGGGGGNQVGVVTVDKTADRGEVQPGSVVGYTVTVRNGGGGVAEGIVVEDQFRSTELSVVEPGGGVVIGSAIRWEIPVMGPGESRVLRYRLRASSALRHGQIIVNNVQVIGAGFDRPATDSTQVSVIEQLPQTGSPSFATAQNRSRDEVRLAATLKPGTPLGADLPVIVWTTIVTMGVSVGSVLGRRIFL